MKFIDKIQAPTPPKSKKLAGLAGTLAGIGIATILANPFSLSFTLPIGIATLLLARYSGKKLSDIITVEDIEKMSEGKLREHRYNLLSKECRRDLNEHESNIFDKIQEEIEKRRS